MVCITTQGPPISQKTWPCVITWQNQHTHLVVSAATAVQVSVVMLIGWVGCTLMGHSLFGFQHEPMAMKNSVDSWELEAMVL